MGRAGFPRPRVDNHSVAAFQGNEVRLSCHGRGPAPEPERVLVLREYGISQSLPAFPLTGDQGGMIEHPLGLVEIGRRPGPVLVVRPEPASPLAGVLTCQELCEPRGPHIRRFPGTWRQGPPVGMTGDKKGVPPVYRGFRAGRQRATVISFLVRPLPSPRWRRFLPGDRHTRALRPTSILGPRPQVSLD